MITKKEFFIFAVSCVALIVFALSGTKTNSLNTAAFVTKEDNLLVSSIKYKNTDLAKKQKKRILRNRRDLKDFRKKLGLNNLSQTLEAAKSNAVAPADPKSKTAVPKLAKKKKDDKKKKKKDDKKKKVAKKKILNPIKPLSPDSNNTSVKTASLLESQDLASTSFTTNSSLNPTRSVADKDLDEDQVAAENRGASQNTVGSLGTVTQLNASKSIFTSLLEEGRFTEFEQLMQSDLSEKKRIQAYQDSLNVLFSSDEEASQEYDLFIYSQFFNDRHAVVISKSLSNPKMTLDQIRYSVSYLNQVVIEWKSNLGNSIFKQIYQDSVSAILSQNEERRDLFTGLQSSITAKSLLLNENSIEVSAN